MYNTLEEYLPVLRQKAFNASKSALNSTSFFDAVLSAHICTALGEAVKLAESCKTLAELREDVEFTLSELNKETPLNDADSARITVLRGVLADLDGVPAKPKELSFTFHITFYPGAEATMCTGVNITAPSMGDAVRQWEEAHVNDGCILISAINLNVVPKYHLS